MWLKWLPWRYVISRVARSHGFLDPMRLLSRLHRFAQPSEVAEPVELLRAGVVFHARGLINSRAIQHNLDWVWPYWVERQFDPHDDAFVPRAFSITHINLTHRNWTALGLPELDWYPVVDPRGLVTPHYDGWSIDFWVVPDQGDPLLPSRCQDAQQRLITNDRLAVETHVSDDHGELGSVAEVLLRDGRPSCQVSVCATHCHTAWLAVVLRPANPEGISFIHDISWRSPDALVVEGGQIVELSRQPDRICMSQYRRGDVFQDLEFQEPEATAVAKHVECDVGMATAAALYRVRPAEPFELTVHIPQVESDSSSTSISTGSPSDATGTSWRRLIEGSCKLQTPDPQFNQLYDAAVRSLLLHSSTDVFPGPYTYRRFWFRDSAFILHGLLVLGYIERVQQLLELFPNRQTAFGYFHSQEGEWDSNGEAIWIIDRFRRLSGQPLSDELFETVRKGAKWIKGKRLDATMDAPHAGLMPSGFSAEHLGPNDFYYWDDFWSAAGLQCAADVLCAAGWHKAAEECLSEAGDLLRCIDRSIEQTASHRDRRGVPASPHRRMDSGAIGSLASGYPLELWDARDHRLLDTVNFLLDNCTVNGGFFQDMIHSGINAYLSLHLAQVLLRAGDARHFDLTQTVADLASPTGQWPEAIHPRTGGGCMGDGHHVWASAEWVMMIRNCFVREEGERLVLCSGIPPRWLEANETIRFGPTQTPFGPITVELHPGKEPVVRWSADWRGTQPQVEVANGYADSSISVSSEDMRNLSSLL